jgi:hypothetical protein
MIQNATKTKLVKIISICFLLFPVVAQSQDSVRSCKDLQKGIFYSYPKNSPDLYIIYVTDGFEKDVNTITGDSTIWKITSTGDCTSIAQFISSTDRYSEKDRKVLLKHKLFSRVTAITADYYTYTTYLEGVKKIPLLQDTVWLHKKSGISTQIYEKITNTADVHINDTSKYALLYVYRPGKTSVMFDKYPIYFNDVFVCEASNKVGYVFKIYTEGTYTLKSRLNKNADSVSVNMKFGKAYYVRSDIQNSKKLLQNMPDLKMEIINEDDGKTEFNNVKFQTWR